MAIDPRTLTEAELAELMKTATRVTAPTFFAASVTVQMQANEGMVIYARPQAATLPPIGEPAPFALAETVAVVHMSVGAMKDFSLALADQVAAYENILGPIVTEFTRKRSEPKA